MIKIETKDGTIIIIEEITFNMGILFTDEFEPMEATNEDIPKAV